MIFGDDILKYKEDIVHHVCELVKIPSVEAPAEPGKPFGSAVNSALEYVLRLADSMGFVTKNVDGYAGHVEYGSGDTLIGVLVHVDVVPAGDGWRLPPFSATIEDGKIYGRGGCDDKGPAIVALYALKAMKDAGIVPKNKVRVIFGTNEESGMKDMAYYFSKESFPNLGFSPDAGYPIYNREKGILKIKVSDKNSGVISGVGSGVISGVISSVTSGVISGVSSGKNSDGTVDETTFEKLFPFSRISGGTAANVVPASCIGTMPRENLTETELEKLNTAAASYSGCKITIEQQGSSVIITAHGKPAHASTPEVGNNAISHYFEFLSTVSINQKTTALMKYLHQGVGLATDGGPMKVNCMDEESGPLTLNLGTVEILQDSGSAVIDIRYPVTKNGSEIIHALSEFAEKYGVEINVANHLEPLYIKEGHPLLVTLASAYEKATGEEAKLLSMGGGTYARTLKNNGVAFGSAEGANIHQADEYVTIDGLVSHGRICTEAIFELAATEYKL